LPSGRIALFLLLAGLQRLQCLADQSPPQFHFQFRRRPGVPYDMNDAIAENDAINADHLRNRQSGSDLHRRDPCLLQFGCNRSAAARAGSSGGGEYDRVDSLKLGFGRHFTAHAARI
jgi:hypothetical protein